LNPPAHHITDAPAAADAKTAGTAENVQAPHPSGPKAAKTDSREEDEKGTEAKTRESAPTEQPTAI